MNTILMVIGFAMAVALVSWAVGPELRDALLKVTKALHNGAGSDTTDAVDTGVGAAGVQSRDLEFLLSAPALSTTELPDTRTVTYKVVHSDAADLSGAVDLMPSVIVQTGAGGAGAAAATYRFRLPSISRRYIGVTATVGASGGNCSGKNFTLEAVI